MNAIPSGIAVSASPKLWIRSANSATLPVATKMAPCKSEVTRSTARLMPTVLRPSRERTIERSISP